MKTYRLFWDKSKSSRCCNSDIGARSERSLQERSRIFKAPPNFSMLRIHLSPSSISSFKERGLSDF